MVVDTGPQLSPFTYYLSIFIGLNKQGKFPRFSQKVSNGSLV